MNQAKAAGNFGWPFLVANNKPYPVFDFATGKPVRMTDPARPKNTGIRNTVLTDMPLGQSAFIWYPHSESTEFPVMGKGEKLEKLEVLDEGYRHPMDMEMAADGSIWLLEYGSDWYFNKNGRLLQLLPPVRRSEPLPTAPKIEATAVAGKDRTYEVANSSDPIPVTWWLTTGATER